MRTPTPAPVQPSDRVRLRPYLTPLRRSDREIQLGFDTGDGVVLADPDGVIGQVLGLMDGRHRCRDLRLEAERLGVAAGQLDALIQALASAGLLQPDAAPVPGSSTIRLVGLGPAGHQIGSQLLRAGVGCLLLVDPAAPTAADRWRTGSDRVRVAEHWSQPIDRPIDLTILVGSRLEPDRAVTTTLTQSDHPHLLVRPRSHGAVVGPLVVPGMTSCVRCADLTRTRADSAWPRMLAQLCQTRGNWDPLAVDWAAALATTQVLGHLEGRPMETLSATLELGPASWSWQRRLWPVDPACGCGWSTPAEW